MGKHRWITLALFTISLLCFAMAAFSEECESDIKYGPGSCIYKPYEITTVLITLFFFDTEIQMQEFYLEKFGAANDEDEIDPLMRAFSGAEPYPEMNFCHLDLYALRPVLVDDRYTLDIGHEVIHCVYGPNYHVDW